MGLGTVLGPRKRLPGVSGGHVHVKVVDFPGSVFQNSAPLDESRDERGEGLDGYNRMATAGGFAKATPQDPLP